MPIYDYLAIIDWINISKIMSISSFIYAFIPLYGAGVRLRIYLRLREFFRKRQWIFWGQCLKSLIQYKYGMEISINAIISPKVQFMHTVGTVIGEGVVVKEGVVLYSGVTLGRKDITKDDDYPYIEEGVILSTGCSVLGKVKVGKDAIIGAHSLLIQDAIGGVFMQEYPLSA